MLSLIDHIREHCEFDGKLTSITTDNHKIMFLDSGIRMNNIAEVHEYANKNHNNTRPR
mgnify:CR=1 FL=1